MKVHHSESFYANFACILQAAEKLGVYELPAVRNKFSAKNLRRFDSVDPAMSVKGLSLGRSPLFSASTVDGPLRVILTDARRLKQKPVQLAKRATAQV